MASAEDRRLTKEVNSVNVFYRKNVVLGVQTGNGIDSRATWLNVNPPQSFHNLLSSTQWVNKTDGSSQGRYGSSSCIVDIDSVEWALISDAGGMKSGPLAILAADR